ncbi:MAG: urea carboxylase-associated family protein [Alphaproteobacteria bacterium]
METLVVPAAEGRAVSVAKGRRLRIVTPHGGQAADFFAFRSSDMDEWLSPMHTWVLSRSIKPRQGDTFLSRYRRPLLDFADDGAAGVHDMLLAACDAARYEQLGCEGPHASCAGNLKTAMAGRGVDIAVVPQPVNFFTHTRIDAFGVLTSPPNPVPPGAYVELTALTDLVCVVSSCPFDLALSDWPINAPVGPTELVVELH